MAHLNRNLPFIRNWQTLRDHNISLDAGADTFHVIRDSELHGRHCPHAGSYPNANAMTIDDALTRDNWCNHCANTNDAHDYDYRLDVIGAAARYRRHTEPLAALDVFPASQARMLIRAVNADAAHPLLADTVTLLGQLLDTDTARTELLNIAAIIGAATHLEPSPDIDRDLNEHLVRTGHTDHLRFHDDTVHDTYIACQTDPHATLNELAHLINAHPASLHRAHAALTEPDPTCQLTVSCDVDVALFGSAWPHHTERHVHILHIPAAIAALSWRAHMTVTTSCEPAAITSTFLRTCGQLLVEQLGNTHNPDTDIVDDIVRTVTALTT
jgi:hypothetical protein